MAYRCPPPGAAPWPPPSLDEYSLRGPQVEPDASYWTIEPCPVPCVVRVSDLTKWTDDRRHSCYFPPYPDEDTTRQEIEEIMELACLRDDPEGLMSTQRGRERLGLSWFLNLVPQPLGAVVNTLRFGDASLINVGPESLRSSCRPSPLSYPQPPCPGGCHDELFPVIRTGRELARYFESETPGLAHRLALNYLLREANFSPPRQAMIWMALDVTIYSALAAAWYYKWLAGAEPVPPPCRPQGRQRNRVSRRPRPVEFDYRVDVLYNRAVNCHGSGDGDRRILPDPSPGTPRHPSYPSGHSTYAGAASEILSYFFPDYTGEFDKLADNVGMARLWAGIHYRSDHLQGMKLGRCVARLVIHQLQEGCIGRPDPCDQGDCKGLPPTYDDLRGCARGHCECCARKGEGFPRPQAAEDVADVGQAPGAPPSSAAVAEQSRSPQQGAPAGGDPKDAAEQARGPQQGTPPAGSSQQQREQAKGPQEGAR